MRRHFRVLTAVLAVFVGLVGPDPGSAYAAPAAAPPAIPVTIGTVTVQDVPVYLRGLGTVQALATVEIKAQVNGALIAVPVREGQEVKPGTIIAEIDPRPYKAALDQATAQRAEDTAQLRSAQLDLGRYQNLARRGFAPGQQVDDQQATVSKLVAAVQADSAAIETARINLGFCTIRAPIGGRVGLYQTDAGNLIEVASQTGIVSITQDKPIGVVFTLPEAELPRIQQAMSQRTLPVLVYTTDNTTQLAAGTLLTPNNTIDVATGTIQLKATFANTNDRLWPGEFVNARLLVATLHDALTVPLAAVQHGPDGLFVYTVGADHVARQQAITVGYQEDTAAVVTHGLQRGATVIVAGQSRVSPGAQVKVTRTDRATPSGRESAAGARAGISGAAASD